MESKHNNYIDNKKEQKDSSEDPKTRSFPVEVSFQYKDKRKFSEIAKGPTHRINSSQDYKSSHYSNSLSSNKTSFVLRNNDNSTKKEEEGSGILSIIGGAIGGGLMAYICGGYLGSVLVFSVIGGFLGWKNFQKRQNN